MRKKILKINLIKGTSILPDKHGQAVNTYSGSIKVKDLLDNYKIPFYDPDNPSPKDYQRMPNPSRITKVMERLDDKLDAWDVFVDSINLNLRLNKENENLYFKPLTKDKESIGDVYELTLPEPIPFFVVDGQTRLKGLELLVNTLANPSQKHSQLMEKSISFNLSVTDDEYREGYTFFLINKHAKSVPPEGASKLIYNGSKAGDIYFENEIQHLPNLNKEIIWMDIAHEIYNNSTLWSPLIKDYNQKSAGRIISIRAIANSLVSQFYDIVEQNHSKIKGSVPIEKICAQIFESYWQGIEQVFPDFASRQFTMTKASNAEVMCKILNSILTWHFQKQYTMKNVLSPKDYAAHFSHIFNNFKDMNSLNKQVSKKELWRTGKNGSMGKYTSASAKSNLFYAMRQELINELNKKPGVNIA